MGGHGNEVDAHGLRRFDDLLRSLAEADDAIHLDAWQGQRHALEIGERLHLHAGRLLVGVGDDAVATLNRFGLRRHTKQAHPGPL